MTRFAGIVVYLLLPFLALGQGGDQQLRAKADALFDEQHFTEALPMYSQLVSLTPSDRQLNYRFGTCLLFEGEDKEKAVSYLKYATEDPSIPAAAWYWLGRAYHLSYRFKEAAVAYQRFRGTGDTKALAALPVESLEKQCRNGEKLLSNLKEIIVRNKVEVAGAEFFRFYDLTDIGGRIVVLPEELKTSLDRKSKVNQLVYLPDRGGPIYFSSFGKDGKTGRDIYRTELMPDGKFATPIKLAGYINTDLDEDFAFMHQDGRTFYFSSEGHNSMGGYDVFRSTYDRGLDAFGRPENMDFAVNTPDDDIFYIVDGEQKEACFASARSSSQGKVHVYRVNTVQQPVIITIFKGTFASTIDKEDRKAHIVVEDAVTRELVADVRTDINGSYVLSLPRSGSFRYRVECGPSGKTHIGVVDVPKSDGPRAYRQELALGLSGDLEQLTIRNYFDAPLEDDIIALSLDEIKRRARLDITENAPVAEALPAPEALPHGDVMTRAGFTGDIDQAAAVRLANEDARELDQQALNLEAQRDEAFAIAVEAAAEADRTTARAAALVDSATATNDEERRNALMVEAARARQRSREANLRSRAAFRTGTALDTERMATQQRTAVAEKLATELTASVAAKNDERTLTQLRALKQRLDAKSGPDALTDVAEKARWAVTEQEKAVARAMQVATTQRADENELTDRIARSKREMDETRTRSRKDELAREITQLEEQRGHLRNETAGAFAKAAVLERETAVMRGQASLTRHLTTTADRGPGANLNADQVADLGLRITGAASRIDAIPIDERYDAMLTATPAEVEARTFDWDLASAGKGVGTERAATAAADRDASTEAQRANGRTTTMQDGGSDERRPETATIGQVPTTAGAEEQAVAGVTERDGAEPLAQRSTTVPAGTNGDRAPENGATTTTTRTQEEDGAVGTSTATEVMTPVEQETTSTQAVGDRFLLENERAEVAQMLAVERDRIRRDSLQGRIAELDRRLAADGVAEPTADAGSDSALSAVEREDLNSGPVDMNRPIVRFDRETEEEEILMQLFADYATDKQRLMQLADADERAAGLNGLELMLADSIRGEMAREVAVLDLAPEQAAQVLPRVDRLRQMRAAHIQEGERALQQRQDELLALAGAPPTSVQRNGKAPLAGYPPGQDPINDRFVVVANDPLEIYTSTVQHRATSVDDAVAFKEADITRMEDLSEKVDSLEDVLAGMPPSREFDRLRKETDQMIDEHMIIRTDMGQRSAFLMKEEWTAATDSLQKVERIVAARGLAPNEPVLQLAKSMQGDAQRRFDQAAQFRKRADKLDDIVVRDSLYRQAYGLELEALRDMDRAITVQNYLAGNDHTRGELLAYEPIASKVLGIALPTEEIADVAMQHGSSGQEQDAATTEAGSPELAAGSQREEALAASENGTERIVPVNSASNAEDTIVSTNVPATSASEVDGASAERAKAAATEQALLTEARLGEEAKRPLRLYESFLSSEGVVLPETAMDPEMEPRLLSLKADRAAQEAAALNRRSVDLADQATLLADSAVNAKKRDRERLEQLAALTRAASDSIHAASLAKSEEARLVTEQKREAEQAQAYRERLVKYYYLTGEEQDMVMENADESRYFQAKTRALEQYDAADEAASAAASNREVGRLLQQQAAASATDLSPAEVVERARVLNERASVLIVRADSLDNVAARLRGAAAINENQASVLLQGMPADRSTALMALEMRTRRSEPLLSEALAQGGTAPRTVVPSERAANQPPVVGLQGNTANDVLSAAASPTTTAPSSNAPATLANGNDRAATNQPGAEPVPVEPTAQGNAQPATTAVPSAAVREGSADVASPVAVPGTLAADVFELRSPTTRRVAAIPIDAPMPAGIVFEVQIGAFRNAVPEEAFGDMSPVAGESVGNGLVRYTAGMFVGFDGAASAKDQVRDRGYRDAFVVAYRDGQRIPLGEAMRETRGAQPALAQRTVEPVAVIERPAAMIQSPVPVVAVAEPDIATVLAAYPATAEEVVARFAPAPEATAYYNVPGAAPARQVETVQGLFFTVQVGVYSKPVPLDKIFNITPLNSERTETAKVRYTTGVYLDVEKARVRKDETVALGVKDAFITAYLNGKRIPMREANALLAKFGPAILAKP